ncbi:MAG: methyltransferase domain-containing protein [Alcanivorax sp.]|nr:methyltransferase domain-containing protein [Alcanivorax sp.]
MGLYEDQLFPVLLDWATRPLYRDRQQLIAQASGRVLELGVGNGANLAFYGPQATEIHGIEPAAALLTRARQSADQCPSPQRFQLLAGDAQCLPYPDQSFDTVIACLVFCTIPDPQRAAAEAFRVLKPGGQLLTLEHVRSKRRWVQRVQHTLDPAWKHLACGCHLTRDTADIFARAGFVSDNSQHRRHPKLPAFAAELLNGRLLRP